MKAMEWAASLGAKLWVYWGGQGAEKATPRIPIDAIKRFRECVDFLCEYSVSQKYNYRFAFEAKPNEPRGHLYFAVTGSYLRALIPTLARPELYGVNPEVAHEHMAGLNFVHHVGQAIELGKLFHIDLINQEFGRYQPGFPVRFGEPEARLSL